MRYIIQKIWNLLTAKERVGMSCLIIALIISGGFELLGIGLVMPIIALLSKPELVEQNKQLKLVYDFFQPSSQSQFVLILCFTVIGIYIFKNLFMLKLTQAISSFVMNKSASFASTLFFNYVNAPYEYHLKYSSSELHKKLDIISTAYSTIFQALLVVISDTVIICCILLMLLYFSPLTTLILATIFLVINFGVYMPFKDYNYSLGQKFLNYNQEITKYDLQALRGIKEVIVGDFQDKLSSSYNDLQQKRGRTNSKRYVVGQVPRFFIETLVVVMGLGTLATFVLCGLAHGSIILQLGLLAVSMIRIMPSMSRIQYNITLIRQFLHPFNTIYQDLVKLKPVKVETSENPPLEFKDCLEIKDMTFAYNENDNVLFDKFNLSIPHAASVAFVGTTGCGKTTLIDIILGLLKPQTGKITVDGRDIEENLSSWRKLIGYVPQFIFLRNSSIAENVALGYKDKDIDMEKVKACLKIAQLDKFVDTLPKKTETLVGENGVRLSGGQRQRIGIARALYHDPEILVLDEATSALDSETENAFVDALNCLKGKLTIIMIAHRLTTVENCDKVIKLEAQKLKNGEEK